MSGCGLVLACGQCWLVVGIGWLRVGAGWLNAGAGGLACGFYWLLVVKCGGARKGSNVQE
jgi:hypothetical protein